MTLVEVDTEQQDALAQIAVERFKRARDFRQQHVVYQGLSVEQLYSRSEAQLRREYTSDDAARMQRAFGFCPTRYYPLAAFKCQAVTAWRLNLVAPNLDGLFTVAPTPNPTLDDAAMEAIREQVKQRLVERMTASGVADPRLLLDARGQPARQLERFLREQVRELKGVEEALVVSRARQSAERISTYMRDALVEGGMRQAYQLYATDAVSYGFGVMRFVPSARTPVLAHSSGTSRTPGSTWRWANRPQFKHVPTRDFYPTPDTDSLSTNTGNTEHTRITKAELIGLAKSKHYKSDVIREIIEDFAGGSRDWLGIGDMSDTDDASIWELDQTIPLLVHEGFFSGGELADYGITGVGIMDYVTARVEVCGHRTIRAELVRLPDGSDRSFFGSPYNKIGSNLLDVIGLPAQLWDNEQRINTLWHVYETNVDWAARPPIMVNSSVFSDPNDALSVVPGGTYDVQERYGSQGVMPNPMMSMNTVSAQYHLLLTQINAIIRDSDEITGLPGFALGGTQGFGNASLGEYSQRVSNSLRIIQQILLNEDMFFIEPAMTALFHWVVKENPDLLRGADVQVVVRGTTGLMQKEASAARLQGVLGLILGDQSGVVDPQVKKYAIHQIYEQAGIPATALGVGDPMIDAALAAAAVAPSGSFGPMGQQVPALDGRSAAALSTGMMASPTGAPIPGPPVGSAPSIRGG